jgi:hypothetical protein
MVPDDFFQLYSRKNDMDDFGAWGTPPGIMKTKILFLPIQTNVLIESGVPITYIIMRTFKSPLFHKKS